jgi:hypothetical protein
MRIMSDDEIALKLMRLYKELRSAGDLAVRQAVCDAIDSLVAQLKRTPEGQPHLHQRQAASAHAAAAGND